MFSDGVEDPWDRLVQRAAEVADTAIACIALQAGPSLVFRSQVGLPEALSLSGGARLSHWPIRFTSSEDPPLRLFVDPQQEMPDSAARLIGSFSALAVPIAVADGLAGALTVIDPKNRELPSYVADDLRILWLHASRGVRDRVSHAVIDALRDTLVDPHALNCSIVDAAKEARWASDRLRMASARARWHVMGQLPATPEFVGVVDDALLAAAELSRSLERILSALRKSQPQPGLDQVRSALADALLVGPAYAPVLRIARASRAALRTAALCGAALAALPPAVDLELWSADIMEALVQASTELLKVRTSSPAA